jgi:hypothetical protein
MKFLRRKRVKLEVKPASFDPITVSATGGNTTISNAQFKITLPGEWKQSDETERVAFIDSTGEQRLFLNRFTITGKLRIGGLRNLCVEYAGLKQRKMSDFAKGEAAFAQMDVRKIRDEEDLRFHGFDAANKVACYTLFRANPTQLIDFSVYQYNLADFDPKAHDSYQVVFDKIKIT